MFRYEPPLPDGFIFELSHPSLYSFTRQRAPVAPTLVGSERRRRFEAPWGIHGAAAMPHAISLLCIGSQLQTSLQSCSLINRQPIAARRSRKVLRAVAIEPTIVWDRDCRPAAHMQRGTWVG